MRGTDLRQRTVINHQVVVAAERGVRHHRDFVLLAPWQKIALNSSLI